MLGIYSFNDKPAEAEEEDENDKQKAGILLNNNINKNRLNVSPLDGKKRILLLLDMYGWSFHNIAKKIKEKFTDYTVDILTTVDFYNNTRKILTNPYHIYCFFFASPLFTKNELNHIKNIGKYKFGKKSSMFWCMYDNFSWRIDTCYNKHSKQLLLYNMEYWMKECDGYFWGSPKIRDNIYNTFKTIKPAASCMDGVNTTMFNFKEYDEDILTKKKLRLGWIGNSDIKASGRQKGFQEIKKYVEDLSANFEFFPLDKQIKQIPHNMVPNYIHNIDIIVCYSTCEGTPNQILEGSSCGRCWVSTDVGVVSSVYNTIENNPTGIIIKKNETAFKDALMKLYNNRELIIEYGKNGRKAIELKWDWKYRLEGFQRMFNQVLKNW